MPVKDLQLKAPHIHLSSALIHKHKYVFKTTSSRRVRTFFSRNPTEVGFLNSYAYSSVRWVCIGIKPRVSQLQSGLCGDVRWHTRAVLSCCSTSARPPQNTGMFMNESRGEAAWHTLTAGEHRQVWQVKTVRSFDFAPSSDRHMSGTECAFSNDLWQMRSRSNLFQEWESLWLINHTFTVHDEVQYPSPAGRVWGETGAASRHMVTLLLTSHLNCMWSAERVKKNTFK